MNEIDQINDLCGYTTRPSVLNALHACRPGHPLGCDNAWKWRNAYALVRQHTIEFLHADTSWLERQAQTEWGPVFHDYQWGCDAPSGVEATR